MMKNKYLIFTVMGVELVGLILGSLFLGRYLDDHLKTQGLIMVALSLLSLAGWLFHIVILAKSLEKNAKANDRESQS